MSKPDHVYTVHIKGSVADVWDAIVNPDKTAQYFYGTRAESSWEPGSPIQYLYPDGSVAADGEIVEFVPEKRVEMTFTARWDAELEAEGPVREAWIVTETEGATMLTVETYDMPPSSKRYADFAADEGLAFIVSGLKTLVETGSPMTG